MILATKQYNSRSLNKLRVTPWLNNNPVLENPVVFGYPQLYRRKDMLLSELGAPVAGLMDKINETWRRL
ncbi:MAG: hypothetical protein LBU66_05770 [Treponema sp.]|nr:hypothetical protein [Treponema sp.]